jgi:hypothetical protein
MIKRILYLIAFFSITFAYSCSNVESRKKDNVDKVSEGIEGDVEKIAEIEFVEDFVDLGTITHGEVIAYSFNFSNSGNKPLIVFDIVAGCGCTKTKVSKDILNPGEKSNLEVVFDSKGWYGSQYKTVTVVTNAPTPKRTVTIKVNIVH